MSVASAMPRLALLTVLSVLSSFLVLVATSQSAEATHFRYRDVAWTSDGNTSTPTVTFTARIADRASAYGGIAQGSPFSETFAFGDGSSGSLNGTVVAVNSVDDWFIAELRGTHTYASPGPWTVTWDSCCTLSTLQNSSDSSLRSRTLVNVGTDGSRNIGSPATSVPPIVNLPATAGVQTFRVPGRDPDGDNISYRLASPAEAVISQPPGLSIDSRTGIASWDTTSRASGLWITSVVIADAKGAETQVTFLLNLGGSSSDAPDWINPTPEDQSKFKASVGQSTSFTLRARDPDGDPVTITPLGLPGALACNARTDNQDAVMDCTYTATGPGFFLASFDAQDPSGASAGVRSFRVGTGRYVALGDSYSSGENVPDYDSGTRTETNACHRNSRLSYPGLVAKARGYVNETFQFVACSGAVTYDLWFNNRAGAKIAGEYPQFDVKGPGLGDDVDLVTMTMGGNDAGFSNVLKQCLLANAASLSCGPLGDLQVNAAMDKLSGKVVDPNDAISSYDEVFKHLRKHAPRARVLIVGYPQFFRTDGTLILACTGVGSGDQRWINSKVAAINKLSQAKAQAHGFEFVETSSHFEGRRLCDLPEQWFAPLKPHWDSQVIQESFHPNAAGHEAMSRAVLNTLGQRPSGSKVMTPGQSSITTILVSGAVQALQGVRSLRTVIRWPGSDFVLTLRGPNGEVITRGSVPSGVEHDLGPTFESYSVPNPAPGEWTVEVFAADVPPSGEEVQLTTLVEEAPNEIPVAAVSHSLTGATVEVDGRSSSDTDGTVDDYLWDFGDGTVARGLTASHTYTQPGRYVVTLQVTDSGGDVDFAGTPEFDVELPPPAVFGGFLPPTVLPPQANSAGAAGRTLPVAWKLTSPDGAPVTDPASFLRVESRRADCRTGKPTGEVAVAAATAGLTHDGAGRWQYAWATDRSWSRTCRSMTLFLDDGEREGHALLFRFN